MNGILCCLGMGSEYNAENHSRRNYNWTITWEQVGWYKIFYFPLGPAPDKSWPGCDLTGTSICSDVFSGEQIKLQGEHRWAWEAGDETWVSLLPTLTGSWGGARFGHLLNVLLENWFRIQWGRACSDCYSLRAGVGGLCGFPGKFSISNVQIIQTQLLKAGCLCGHTVFACQSLTDPAALEPTGWCWKSCVPSWSLKPYPFFFCIFQLLEAPTFLGFWPLSSS